jgi:hypothetical protein
LRLAALKNRIDNSLALKLGIILLLGLALLVGQVGTVSAAGATTSVRVASYAEDGKDKGGVMGTDIKDLCDMVGDMQPGDEVVVCSIDGYQVRFSYENIYQPLDRQGPIVLCWYKAEDAGTNYDFGYPGNDAYSSALQLVFMAKTQNPEGKFVFGNMDMKICLPEEKYQHFYEGLPSTNGLSAKWVSEVRVYTGGAPDRIESDDFEPAEADNNRTILWLPIVLGSLGLLLVAWVLFFVARRKG